MSRFSSKTVNYKKILGNPKITFVLGGPASGKGTQCAKLVEEFGYTHISTGDLMRAEIASGSAEGNQIKEIVSKGELVPHQLTVQVLVNALIATPSQNYLIDGFPRSVAQAEYFEQTVTECQTVLFFNVSFETCVARCMERAKTSGRLDDTQEVIENRLTVYANESKPVVEMYRQFGRVREVDGGRDVGEVWNDTRRSMLPQVSFIIGAHASGKTVLGNTICDRSNATLLKMKDFLEKENLLQEKSEELIVMALIKRLANELSPRVLIEDFPQTEFQARFFMANCVQPKDVFMLSCSKDTCQERMLDMGQQHPNYLPSALLSKKIKLFNERCVELLPYLRSATNLREINTEQSFNVAQQIICKMIEPTIVHVRSNQLSENSKGVHSQIEENLVGSEGFRLLDVDQLRASEERRGTELGLKLRNCTDPCNPEPVHVVEMLKRVIFSGNAKDCKFMLKNFPLSPEQASFFEKECAKITAIVFAAGSGGKGDQRTIEVDQNGLGIASLDAIFQKDFRLKTMREWDNEQFKSILGQNIEWCFVIGRTLGGKTELCKQLMPLVCNGKTISMEKIASEIKKTLGSEDEPFDGEVPNNLVEEQVLEMVASDKQKGEQFTYIFDNYTHKSPAEFLKFTQDQLGQPAYWVYAQCEQKIVEDRWAKKNDAEDGAPADAVAEIVDQGKAAESCAKDIECIVTNPKAKICINTDVSIEQLQASLRAQFSAKVVIVNHEKQLPVDTQCANLATKFGMLYLSVYQLIKQHVEGKTEIGAKLEACRKPKSLHALSVESQNDNFNEGTYSAVHFDLDTVVEMISKTIAEKRKAGEEYILLEGLCNNRKLSKEDDRLSLRYMDELFIIEKGIGEVAAVISLQKEEEMTTFIEDKFEVFEVPVVEVKEKKVREEGDEENEEEEEPVPEPAEEEGEEGENKKPKFDPSAHKWTVTNRNAKNLPQVFRDYKGINFHPEVKQAKEFGEGAVGDQISGVLDAFMQRVLEESSARYIYQQVIF